MHMMPKGIIIYHEDEQSIFSDGSSFAAGVLYYGDVAANGVKASTFVEELTTRAEYEHFISAQPDNILTVIQVNSPLHSFKSISGLPSLKHLSVASPINPHGQKCQTQAVSNGFGDDETSICTCTR